jgi:hypothetical protein
MAPKERFSKHVHMQYFDLFDPDYPSMPPGAQLPLVLVNGEVFSSGGEISVPALRRKIESLYGETPESEAQRDDQL